MASCELCGKHLSFGRRESKKRKNRTSRTFKPNLQHATLSLDGRERKVTACTRCIRTANRIRQ